MTACLNTAVQSHYSSLRMQAKDDCDPHRHMTMGGP